MQTHYFFSGLIVFEVSGGKGLRLVLGSGSMSEIGIQDSYSCSFLGIQQSQRYSLKCHIISAFLSRVHSFSVMVLVCSPAMTCGLKYIDIPYKKPIRHGLIIFISAIEVEFSNSRYLSFNTWLCLP